MNTLKLYAIAAPGAMGNLLICANTNLCLLNDFFRGSAAEEGIEGVFQKFVGGPITTENLSKLLQMIYDEVVMPLLLMDQAKASGIQLPQRVILQDITCCQMGPDAHKVMFDTGFPLEMICETNPLQIWL